VSWNCYNHRLAHAREVVCNCVRLFEVSEVYKVGLRDAADEGTFFFRNVGNCLSFDTV
jgi:hypothetical protein